MQYQNRALAATFYLARMGVITLTGEADPLERQIATLRTGAATGGLTGMDLLEQMGLPRSHIERGAELLSDRKQGSEILGSPTISTLPKGKRFSNWDRPANSERSHPKVLRSTKAPGVVAITGKIKGSLPNSPPWSLLPWRELPDPRRNPPFRRFRPCIRQVGLTKLGIICD